MNRYKVGIDMSGGITNDKRMSVNIFWNFCKAKDL